MEEKPGISTEPPKEKSHQHLLITVEGDTIPTGKLIPAANKRIESDSMIEPLPKPLLTTPKVVRAHPNVHPAAKPIVVQVPKELKIITPKEKA